MKINILYEDTDYLAIDKPAGLPVHPDGKTKGESVTDWVIKKYPEMEDVGEPMRITNPHQVESSKVHKVKSKSDSEPSALGYITIPRPGIVHRLDKDTSGVLVLAKNQEAYEFLKNQFKDRKIKKVYHTIVSGFVKEDRGTLNKPIGRSPNDFRRRLAGRGARGEMREAITEYSVLKRFISEDENKFTYLEVRPKTGRTHQIRVHMKYLNHPVVHDNLYNPGKPAPEGITRMALHAKSIEFKNLKGDTVKVESPLPKEFIY